MSLLHRMLLRALPAPFVGALGTLVFLLILQFLIRFSKDLIGRGLPGGIVGELIAYNMAYILALAVPMSVFFAALVAVARLSESQAVTVAQASGVSPVRLLWPLAVVGALSTGAMVYVNNVVLPEANYRARSLWQDIRRTQPAFALRPGVFFTRLSGYAILAQRIPRSDRMEDLLVYDLTRGTEARVVIKAARGRLVPEGGERVSLVLEDGSVERDAPGGAPVAVAAPPAIDPATGAALPVVASFGATGRTERVRFERLRIRLDLGGFRFERTPRDGFRNDRTTPTTALLAQLDSLDRQQRADDGRRDSLRAVLAGDDPARTARPRGDPARGDSIAPAPVRTDTLRPSAAPRADALLAGLDAPQAGLVLQRASAAVSTHRAEAESLVRSAEWNRREANALRVEVHKKQAIAAACFVFALAGAYLGLGVRARRGGLARAGVVAVGLFLVFWVTLVIGEKLSDRYLWVPPALAMWSANAVIGAAFAFLLARTSWRRG